LSSDVPDFGKYVSDYWSERYGLEECNVSNDGEISDKSHFVHSDARTTATYISWICKNGAWEKASILDALGDCNEEVGIVVKVLPGAEKPIYADGNLGYFLCSTWNNDSDWGWNDTNMYSMCHYYDSCLLGCDVYDDINCLIN
jgi:hypothetical protein